MLTALSWSAEYADSSSPRLQLVQQLYSRLKLPTGGTQRTVPVTRVHQSGLHMKGNDRKMRIEHVQIVFVCDEGDEAATSHSVFMELVITEANEAATKTGHSWSSRLTHGAGIEMTGLSRHRLKPSAGSMVFDVAASTTA